MQNQSSARYRPLRIAFVLFAFVSALTNGRPALAADDDCVERGGKAVCSNMEKRPQLAQMCTEAGGDVRFLHSCANWGGCSYYPQFGPSKVTPFNTNQLAVAYATGLFACGPPQTNQVTDWLSQGQTLNSGGCYGSAVGPTYQNGIETRNFVQYRMSGVADDPYTGAACDSSYSGETVTANRSIQLVCPQGYRQRSVVYGVYECYRYEEECPSCTVGNPVSPATGKKTQIESDYQGEGEFPLQLVRHYSSYGWFTPPDNGNESSSSMDGYWRTN